MGNGRSRRLKIRLSRVPNEHFSWFAVLGALFLASCPPVFAYRRQIVQPSDEAMRVDFANAQLKLINQRIENLSEYFKQSADNECMNLPSAKWRTKKSSRAIDGVRLTFPRHGGG